MTPITCAKLSPPRGRSLSSPTTRHGRSNTRSTSISTPSAISSNAASQNSSSSAASQPASKRPPEITAPSSLSQQSSYGCDKCPHHLGQALIDRRLSLPESWARDAERRAKAHVGALLGFKSKSKQAAFAARAFRCLPQEPGLPQQQIRDPRLEKG